MCSEGCRGLIRKVRFVYSLLCISFFSSTSYTLFSRRTNYIILQPATHQRLLRTIIAECERISWVTPDLIASFLHGQKYRPRHLRLRLWKTGTKIGKTTKGMYFSQHDGHILIIFCLYSSSTSVSNGVPASFHALFGSALFLYGSL